MAVDGQTIVILGYDGTEDGLPQRVVSLGKATFSFIERAQLP